MEVKVEVKVKVETFNRVINSNDTILRFNLFLFFVFCKPNRPQRDNCCHDSAKTLNCKN